MDDAPAIRASLDEPSKFGLIFDRHYPAVVAYCSRRMGPNAGEEIAAQTFLVAFEHRDRFDPGAASARPWLLGISTNLIRRRSRSEATHLRALRRLPVDRASSDAVGPERLDAQRQAPILIEALLGLPDDDRDAFLLLALAELSYAEIADALAIPVGTVRSKIHRVRRTLRERLGSDTATLDGDDDG